jgi:endonuclease/exonuclease/phosphatase family metal-dependent hydrolase
LDVESLQFIDKKLYMDVIMKFSVLFFLLLSFPGWAKWSVSTYNIRNFDKDSRSGRTDLAELTKVLSDVQSDVMAFEEIVNKKAFEGLLKKVLPQHAFEMSRCGGGGKQNLALAYDRNVFSFVEKIEDLTFSGSRDGSCGSLRPVFLVTLLHKQSNQYYTFGAIHLKAGGNSRAYSQRWEQYESLVTLSKKFSSKNLILLGDFNTTGYILKDEDFEKFDAFLQKSSSKTMTENLACTNYWEGTQGGHDYQPSILDHIVIPGKLVPSVASVRVGSHCAAIDCRPATPEELGPSFMNVSDHCPVQVTFK